MPKIREAVAIAIGVQQGFGQVNDFVRDATELGFAEDIGPPVVALGLFINDESLSLDFDRIEQEEPDYTGTFSKSPGTFQRVDVPLSFATNMQGGGTTTPAGTGDYDLHPAMEAQLSGLGLGTKVSGSAATVYGFPLKSYLTIKIWRGKADGTNQAEYWLLKDCTIESLAVALVPGEKSLGTWTYGVGSVEDHGLETFPSVIDYGTQSSMDPPILRGATAQIGSVLRGFLDGTLTIANDVSEYGDSNADTGIVDEADGRNVTWSGNFYVDDSDPDQDYTNLIQQGSPTEDLFFALGDTIGATLGYAQRLEFTMRNVNFTQVSYTRDAGRVVWNLAGYATHEGTPGDNEFILAGS